MKNRFVISAGATYTHTIYQYIVVWYKDAFKLGAKIKFLSHFENKRKLCPKAAQTCALPLFCNHDLEIYPITLKLKGDLNILKMYPQTENKAASLRHSKLRT